MTPPSLTGSRVLANQHEDFEAWKAARNLGIGASESAGILGLSPWSSPTHVYAVKLGYLQVEDNAAMKWGRWLEEPIVRAVAEELGAAFVLDGRLLQSIRWPTMLCTLDAWTIQEDGDYRVLEAKATDNPRAWEHGVPVYYWVQCQHQMAITGGRWQRIAVKWSVTADPLWSRVERDDRFIEDVLEPACTEFMERLHERDPPPSDGSEYTRKALARMPAGAPASVRLPPRFREIDWEREAVRERISALQARSDEVGNSIRSFMGDATEAVLPGQARYLHRPDARGVRRLLRKDAQDG